MIFRDQILHVGLILGIHYHKIMNAFKLITTCTLFKIFMKQDHF